MLNDIRQITLHVWSDNEGKATCEETFSPEVQEQRKKQAYYEVAIVRLSEVDIEICYPRTMNYDAMREAVDRWFWKWVPDQDGVS